MAVITRVSTMKDEPFKRGLTYAEALAYVGVKRRTFDEAWRPRLIAIRQGSCVIFDKRDLDQLFDEFKARAAEAATAKPVVVPRSVRGTDLPPRLSWPRSAPQPTNGFSFEEAAERILKQRARKLSKPSR